MGIESRADSCHNGLREKARKSLFAPGHHIS
jgi:hypothetical protein